MSSKAQTLAEAWYAAVIAVHIPLRKNCRHLQTRIQTSLDCCQSLVHWTQKWTDPQLTDHLEGCPSLEERLAATSLFLPQAHISVSNAMQLQPQEPCPLPGTLAFLVAKHHEPACL